MARVREFRVKFAGASSNRVSGVQHPPQLRNIERCGKRTIEKMAPILDQVAAALGLQAGSREAYGTIGDVSVRVVLTMAEDGPLHFSLEVANAGSRAHFGACAMNVFGRFNRWAGRELITGDRSFDEEVLIEGDAVEIAAILDAETRGSIRELVAWPTTIRDGCIRVERVPLDTRSVLGNVEALTPYVHRLGPLRSHAELCDRLARNAANDAVSGVRMRNLRLLAQHAVDTPWLEGAVARGLVDHESEIRLLAAEHATPGTAERSPYRAAGSLADPLRVLCELAIGPYPATVRIRAIDLLARRFSRGDVGETLNRLANDENEAIRKAAHRAFGC